ncbi:MAG: peptidylprolyl isomerase [Dehalococcoidia bacterium]|nr:MAG: peptidylprolyl isomerase [Dehalococcoidia bacterium]
MAKNIIEKPKRKPTKRQLSRWQKQKRRQRLIVGIGTSVVIIALSLVVVGVYFQWYVPQEKPFKETVVEVNDTQFDMAYYIDALNYQLAGLSSQQVSLYLDIIADGIQQNELIKQEAMEIGASIGDDEVDKEIETRELPNNQAVRDIIGTQLLVQKLREGYFNDQIPLSTEHRYVMAMLLESEKQANEVRNRLVAGESFSQLAGELSLDDYTKERSGDLGWKPRGVLNELLRTSVLEDYIFSYPIGELVIPVYDAEKTKDLGYWIIEVLERNAETGEARVQAMILSSEEEAKSVLSRLSDGEEFTLLAAEYSQLWSDEDGAELGWLAEGSMTDAFDEFVFNLEIEINEISEPIREEMMDTEGGYWLFKIPDSDFREISEEDRDLLVEKAMQEWLDLIINDPENIVVNYLDEEMREFAISRFSG